MDKINNNMILIITKFKSDKLSIEKKKKTTYFYLTKD